MVIVDQDALRDEAIEAAENLVLVQEVSIHDETVGSGEVQSGVEWKMEEVVEDGIGMGRKY